MLNHQGIKTLGRYEISSKLGEGGMGIVYKATDSFLERTVALKIAKISSTDLIGPDKKRLNRCLKEARLAAQFIHPNIVITYDAGIENDVFFIALEYIEGSGLQASSRKWNLLPRSQVLEIIYNTCYALDYIHNKGYMHLDIKPSNIMLTKKGEVKLMDFGISRFLQEDPKDITKTVGTSYYMSPEQAQSDPGLDHQSDIFSLGIVLYELLTGKRPFEGKSFYETIYKIINVDPVAVKEHAPDISPDLELVVNKAISKKKEERFKTAKEFAEALLPSIKGKDSRALDKQDKKKIDYLKRLPIFKHFQYSDLSDVIKISTWSFHDRNSQIIKKDDDDNNIYFLIQGKAALHLKREVKVLEQGECFGETAILYKMPRKAEVIADTNCVVMTINANILKQASDSIQVKFLREFYNLKILQLVEANLKLIKAGK
ncbi:MAG: serine/threonine-protein kinase [Candidatus Desulfatibia sp.]|uniref:protein kinase domain-containing protein n=1 Tax=Candidatus Desulfatibia sp. TaxID=3101189 RepID=UPI002F2E4A7C